MSEHGGNIYQYNNILDFSANINPLGICDSIKKAVCQSVDDIINYPDPDCSELRKHIGEYENINFENIICGNGAADIIFSVVLAYKPKRAVIIAPTFLEYGNALKSVDCEIRYFDISSSKFILNEKFIDYLTEDIDVVFLCNPNNPTGQVTEKKIIFEILKSCVKKNILLILDECFNDFIEDYDSYSMKNCICEFKNLFILKAFTKMFAIPGLRLGYGICSNKELMLKIKKNTQPWNVSIPAQRAGIAATKEKKFVETTRKYLARERTFICSEFDNIGIEYLIPRANYIFFKSQYDLFNMLIERNILIRDCQNYNFLQKGFYRIAVKKREENEILISELKKIYNIQHSHM